MVRLHSASTLHCTAGSNAPQVTRFANVSTQGTTQWHSEFQALQVVHMYSYVVYSMCVKCFICSVCGVVQVCGCLLVDTLATADCVCVDYLQNAVKASPVCRWCIVNCKQEQHYVYMAKVGYCFFSPLVDLTKVVVTRK